MENDKPSRMPNVPPFVKFVCANVPMVFDDSLSYYEALCALWKYIQGMTDVINNNATLEEEYIEKFNELKEFVDNYFDNLDVQEEINNKLDAMVADGTLQQLINNAIEVMPVGMTLDLARIGRKIFKGTNPLSSNYDASGIACHMQGGTYLGNRKVAYVLWDALSDTLNKNKIIIMDIDTGTIEQQADFTFGWCNSVTNYDGKLYIAERGSYVNGTNTNNGIIKVVNIEDLSLDDTITMDYNVNSLYCHDGKFYILQEGTKNVYVYDPSDFNDPETVIHIDADSDYYQQSICVDDNYIYLIATRPNASVSVYRKDGTRERIYNVENYSGRYYVGELQWLDKTETGDFIFGSDTYNYEECLVQFFRANFKTGVSIDTMIMDNQALYCNSDNDEYTADGSAEHPFKSIMEALYTAYPDKIIRCNNKSYNYFNVSNEQRVRIENATLSEGFYCQYSELALSYVTVNKSINTTYDACCHIRFSNIIFSSTTFNADGNNYIIDDGGYNTYKLSGSSFSGQATAVFNSNIATCKVFANNANNLPYIPRLYNTKFNLAPNSALNAWQASETEYQWNTSLSSTEIGKIRQNSGSVIIGYKGLNKGVRQEIVITNRINTSNDYVITDFVVGGTQLNPRFVKITFQIHDTGLYIKQVVLDEMASDGTWTHTTTPPNQDHSITIDSVAFITEN